MHAEVESRILQGNIYFQFYGGNDEFKGLLFNTVNLI
jgi:hypothetical protein